MRCLRALATITILTAAVISLPGCGGGGNGVKVYGKLAKAGAKYTPPEGQRVTITFYAIEAKDESGKKVVNEPYVATLDADGESFEVNGPEGRGIPPGSYRVAVTQKMYREVFEKTKPTAAPGKPPLTRESDFLQDKYGPATSPIVRDITASGNVGVLDLDKPAG